MKEKKEVFGRGVWAFFQGEEAIEFLERDDGFIDLSAGIHSYFAQFKDWPKIQKQAIKYARGRVLDVGAGAGRVSLYLQEKDYNAVAIDNSPLAIRVCKKRGVTQATVLAIEKIDMFKPNSFDTIIMFGNNFSLFGNFKKAKRLLKVFHKISSPDALILAESNDPYKTKDPLHLAYHASNTRKGRMPGQIRIRVRFRNYIGDWFDYLIVSKTEMKEILKNTGWKVKRFIDSDKSGYISIIEKEQSATQK